MARGEAAAPGVLDHLRMVVMEMCKRRDEEYATEMARKAEHWEDVLDELRREAQRKAPEVCTQHCMYNMGRPCVGPSCWRELLG